MTRRFDAWSAATDRLIDVHPTALLGVALGLARLVVGQLSRPSKPPATPSE